MDFTCLVARIAIVVGLMPCCLTILNFRREVGATLRETRDRAARRLLEAALKGAGIALVLVSCALLVYLGAVLLARGAEWILVP
jgi:cytochrome c biogenesis protein CcdA